MDTFIGTLLLWPLDWAPQDWLPCDGRELSIAQYSPLYSLLGVRFGGNGTTTFCLPDLRGRVPVGVGRLDGGGTTYDLAAKGGAESVSLVSVAQIPAHNHLLNATNDSTSNQPAQNYPGRLMSSGERGAAVTTTGFAPTPTAGKTLHPGVIGSAGEGQPHENRQPYLGLNFIICVNGNYPIRP